MPDHDVPFRKAKAVEYPFDSVLWSTWKWHKWVEPNRTKCGLKIRLQYPPALMGGPGYCSRCFPEMKRRRVRRRR